MGIENDRLVYAYLSRVGDLAQQRQVPSGDRMRLVAGLRDEIDRARARYEPETPAAVRQILERMGTPEEVLAGLDPGTAAAAGGPEPAAESVAEPAPSVPQQRSRDPKPGPAPAGPAEPDWWRLTPGHGLFGSPELPEVEGFVGGVEIPELLERSEPGAAEQADSGPGADTAAPKQTLARYLRERRRAKRTAAAGPEPAGPAGPAPSAGGAAPRPKPHAFLLLAAAVLLVGAVTGYWPLLIGGWLLAYASRVLGPTERKVVVFGLPGAVFAAAVVWLWGRLDGRWGAPLTDEGLGGVFQGMWPWLARAAAIASAAYLTWRSHRRP
ncbi:hypothetical protein AB0953_06565 [Streptomyces sp. NPDC046866]|uniref:HAAS signaling domain-containing protein n=1 Tax=Streptomyces sp. NPDC046866 TaxID=3154921 RepID=UPI003456A067